jgi:hypothetical protein
VDDCHYDYITKLKRKNRDGWMDGWMVLEVVESFLLVDKRNIEGLIG